MAGGTSQGRGRTGPTRIAGHTLRKRFGQHFLRDEAVIADIVDVIHPRPNETLVEIGPGLGALTWPLLERCGRITVVELDRDLATRWRAHAPRVQVVEGDALAIDFSTLGAPGTGLRLVGNLPYNISTPLLFHLVGAAEHVVDQHFMLQKEVVDRMIAPPACSDYGRMSVVLQWRYAMANLLDVGPEAFEPPPRVDSAVVRMLPRPTSDLQGLRAQQLEAVSTVAFSQRRKLLRHALGPWLAARNYAGSFDLQRRAEEVSVTEYVALACELAADAGI